MNKNRNPYISIKSFDISNIHNNIIRYSSIINEFKETKIDY